MSDTPYTGLVRQMRAAANIVQSQQLRELLYTAAGVLGRLAPTPGDDDEARRGTRLAALAEADARLAAVQLAAAPMLAVVRAALRWREAVAGPNGVMEAEIGLLRALTQLDAAGGVPAEVEHEL
mgnify:CR=1 FL=1